MQVSAEKHVTTSAFRPLIHRLTQKALRVTNGDSAAIKSMKHDMAKDLQSIYQEPGAKAMLDFARFVEPRFKSILFMNAVKQEALHGIFVAEVMMRISLEQRKRMNSQTLTEKKQTRTLHQRRPRLIWE